MTSSLFSNLTLSGLPQIQNFQRLWKRLQKLTVDKGHILDS
jgi:hypothetical protein